MTQNNDAKVSPMMAQWHQCKQNAKDTLLLFRLGDFYEAFYEDAILLAKELELTLTKRQEVPMAGIPFHTADGYVDRLVAKGHRVAIAEQLEDPKNVKGIVKRDVVRVVTPGTLVNSSLLSDKNNNYIASLFKLNLVYGFALLDVTTADFRVFEFESENLLMDELSRLRPKELLIPKKFESLQKELIENCKRGFSLITVIKEDWHFDHKSAYDFLLRQFKVHSLEGLGLRDMMPAVQAAGALLTYVQSELNISIDHIQTVKTEKMSSYMALDSATQRHLEIVDSLQEKEKAATLLGLLDRTLTPMGGRLLKHWLLHPLLSVEGIRKRQDAVNYFLGSSKEELRGYLQEVRDLERLIMRIETGFASPRDILGLGMSLEQIEPIRSLLWQTKCMLLEEQVAKLSDVSSLSQKIKVALVEDPPFRLSDGNIFRKGYNKELDELKEIKSDSHAWMANYQTHLKESTQIKTLKVGFTKAFGYYIEVSRGQSGKIPSHFERRQTLVNAERFLTPELKEYEHKMLSAEEKISVMETDLFHKLRKEISQCSHQIREIASAVAVIDCLCSLGDVASKYGYVRPHVDESDIFSVDEGRHPVIEASLRSESFIPNDVYLDSAKERLFVITGPNMAGKSTFIRQVALLAILAQVGSFVPAKKAHIGIIDKVFSRIGASDNLSRGQSTFMVEMTETANILNNVTSKSLVILDEIGRGTSTYDGISIAWAVAEFLLTTPGKMPKTLFATHYCELTELESKIPGAVNYNVSVHEGEEGIVFLRKIVRGGTDKSYGIHVARLAGLPASVIKRAKDMLKSLEEKGQKTIPLPKKNKENTQLSLFATLDSETIKAKELLIKLKETDPNHLSPMQALKMLSEWKANL